MDITLRKVAAWFFGAVFIIAGIGMATESILGGLVTGLVGVFLVPNVRSEISERFDIQFSSWSVVLIAIIGIGVGGTLAPADEVESETPQQVENTPDENSSKASNQGSEQVEDDTEDQQVEQQESQSPEEVDRTHSIGEEFKVGKLSYKVNSVRTSQIIGTNRYLQEEANGEFVLVDIELTNEGKKSTSITNTHMKLVDSQDRSYTIDSETILAVEDSFTFQQLDPGLSQSGTLVYDTPTDQKERRLKIRPATIFSTSQPHYVDLEN